MTTTIAAAGLFHLGFALFHLVFWRLWGWPETLAPSGDLNAAITQTLNIVLLYLFAATGLLLIAAPEAIATSAAGRAFLGIWAGFWLLRAVLQPLLFGLEHTMSRVIFALFLLGAALHAAPLL
jgi:hypothetical protein